MEEDARGLKRIMRGCERREDGRGCERLMRGNRRLFYLIL